MTALYPGDVYGRAYGVTPDGSVIVGFRDPSGNFVEAFRWSGGGLTILAAPGLPSSLARAVSADGSVIVGHGSQIQFTDVQAVRWVDGTGSPLDVPPGTLSSDANGVSADGSVIVGQVTDATGTKAYRWVDGVPESLGTLGASEEIALGVSADGQVIVGRAVFGGGENNNQAFIWTPEAGMRPLRDVLVNDYGIDVTDWLLLEATAVSADGTVFVGRGRDPVGAQLGWRAEIGAPVDDTIIVTMATDEPNDPDSQAARVCDVDRTDSGLQCTLRAAIQVANARAGRDSVAFNIEGAGPHTLIIPTDLDQIVVPVVIDGTTQPGYSGTPVVALQGSGNYGLAISAGNTTVRGLSIGGFAVGVVLGGQGGDVIEGCYIGVRPDGTTAAPNGHGVTVQDTPGHRIGGDAATQGNVISGNLVRGVWAFGANSGGTVIAGNTIGLTASGTEALGNGAEGVLIDGAPDVTVGGTGEGARNVISGNTGAGVMLTGAGATGNVVAGNYIGTNASGTAALGNDAEGVLIEEAPGNTIGGESEAARNVISANGASGPPDPENPIAGVKITGEGASGNVVAGNYIGTDASGTNDLGNATAGVDMNDAPNNLIGGSTTGARNVIAGNGGVVDGQPRGFGIGITGATATGNRIEGNYIGVAADGTTALGNGANGVVIVDAGENTVGGIASAPGAPPGNVIGGHSGGGGGGIGIVGNEFPTPGVAPNNRVQGNLIGTDAAGADSLSNGIGVIINGNADGTLIGGTEAGARNVISGSRLYGIYITDEDRGAGPSGVQVQGNYIGTNVAGADSLANRGAGVFVYSSLFSIENVTIGGGDAGAGNLITGNRSSQVLIGGANVSAVEIANNTIGLFSNGEGAYPEDGQPQRSGIVIGDVGGVQIGLPGAGNVISGNTIGVFLFESDENVIQGNRIGTDPAGTQRRPNAIGVSVAGSSNTIGGTTAAARNVVSGNAISGIQLEGILSGPSLEAGQAAARLLAPFEGPTEDFQLVRRASTLIDRRSLQRDRPAPLHFGGGQANDNVILGNYIGTRSAGNTPLGNGLGRDGDAQIPNVGGGIEITDTATGNVIGGLTEGARNVISGNGIGVAIVGGGANPVSNTSVWYNHIGAGFAAETPVPNLWFGVGISESSGNEIGPQAEGAGNVIAYNGGAGVALFENGHASIRRNLFAQNDSLAIDLLSDGVTANDAGDGDSGPNGLQNFPRFYYTTDGGGALSTTAGLLDGGSGGPFAVDVYASSQCDPLYAYGEGEAFLGTLSLGSGEFEELLPAMAPLGAYVTATATNANARTSEFSACVRVVREEDLAEADVAEGETGIVLDENGIEVDVEVNPEAIPLRSASRGTAAMSTSAAGTLYASRYDLAPDNNTFEGSATSDDGTTVAPDAVSSTRYWTLIADGLTNVTYAACLDINGVSGITNPAQLVVLHRADPGYAWTPSDSSLDGSRLCTSGLTAWGDLGIGGDSLVNPLGNGSGLLVTAMPVNPPVVIPAEGGAFRFRTTVTNDGPEARTFEVWTEATYSDGSVNSPVLGPVTVTLGAGESVTRTIRQRASGGLPPGMYTYTVLVGSFPDGAEASGSFTGTKEGAQTVAARTADRDGARRLGRWEAFYAESGAPVRPGDVWTGTASDSPAAVNDDAVSDDAATASTATLPTVFALHAAYPNPFADRAVLRYDLPEAASVRLVVYDLLGREVARLVDGETEAGAHTAVLDARGLASGVYVVRMTAGAAAFTQRLTLTR